MKKGILALLCLIVLSACKETTKADATPSNDTSIDSEDSLKTEKQSDGLTLLKGDFLFHGDAAVLQTHREVYGVVIDDKMHELNSKAKAFKVEVFDMVPVEVRAKISPRPEGQEGWPYIIEIKEILNVSAPEKTSEDTIKLGS